MRSPGRRLATAVLLASAVTWVAGPLSPAAAVASGLSQLAGTSGCLEGAGNLDGCAAQVGVVSPEALAVSPDGASVYVAGSSLGVFSRASDGSLSQLAGGSGCINAAGTGGCASALGATGDSFDDVAVSADGKNVYYADNGSLLVFSRNPSTGVLSQLASPAGCWSGDGNAGDCGTARGADSFAAQWVVVSADGVSVYVGSSGTGPVSIFTRDATSGALSQAGDTAGCVSGTGDDGNGGDCATDPEPGLRAEGMAISSDGDFAYIANGDSGGGVDLFTRNATTGALTAPGLGVVPCVLDAAAADGTACTAVRALDQIGGLALSPDGATLYAAAAESDSSGGVVALSRDAVTGALTQASGAAGCLTETGQDGETPVGTCATGDALDSAPGVTPTLAVSPDGTTVYATGAGQPAVAILARDVASGALSQAAGSAGCHGDSGNTASCTIDRGMDGLDAVAVSADGKNVYGATANGAVSYGHPLRFQVSGTASPALGGSVTAASSSADAVCSAGSCTVDTGSTVTLTEKLHAGYRFADWSGDCSGTKSVCTLTNVTADRTAVAHFAQTGTRLVKDINAAAGGAPSKPLDLTPFAGKVFFSATDASHGRELWESDGSADGTTLVDDIRSGSASSTPTDLTVVGHELFFAANDGTHGTELWKTDGTSHGTTLVRDIRVGALSSGPHNLVALRGTLLFWANDGTHGAELWASNGTLHGTKLVKDIDRGSGGSTAQQPMTTIGSDVFFAADDGTHGVELWKSNGSAHGTQLVSDIFVGHSKKHGVRTPNSSKPSNLTDFGGKLYFSAADARHGDELWKSDGTAAGTKIIKDIHPGPANSDPGSLIDFRGRLFFAASDGTHGNALWISDGTTHGTKLFTTGGDIFKVRQAATKRFPDPTSLAVAGHQLFFVSNGGTTGRELWVTDGKFADTQLVKNINPAKGGPPGSDASSSPSDLTAVGSELFFAADDGVHGFEVWKSDGTAAGTKLVKDINTKSAGKVATASAYPAELTVGTHDVFFTADDGVHGKELWASATVKP